MTILEELHQCGIKNNEYVVKGLKDICYEFSVNNFVYNNNEDNVYLENSNWDDWFEFETVV